MAASLPIPLYTSLDQSGEALTQAAKLNHLAEEFQTRFGRKPAYIARAPGRVNLIGEHIDYALFGVFPAAVERDILIACAPRFHAVPSEPHHGPGGVVAENLHTSYKRQTFAPVRQVTYEAEAQEDVRVWHLDIDKSELRWESYVKAGYYGVLNKFYQGLDDHPIPVDLLVTGSVPAGSGLSSSAAMVVASTLSFLAVNNKLEGLSKGALVEMAVENEKRVGVNSGGMDQAASVISTSNSALYVTFFPKLSAEPIKLPTTLTTPPAVFVIANSLVVSDKAVQAKTQYNLRVVETLVGARVLARNLGVSVGTTEKVTFRQVLGRWIGVDELKEEIDIPRLADGLERILDKVETLKPTRETGGGDPTELGVTFEDMVVLSGLTEAEFKELFLSWVEVEATYFQLYKRARHVYSEALRVLQFRDICLRSSSTPPTSTPPASTPPASTPPASTLQALGDLMNISQKSCSEDFECSCPELNELTALAGASGAYGSRLTGAGWGGCTVSLVREDEVEAFAAKLKAGYGPYKELSEARLKEVIFSTKPSSGAYVFKLDD